MFGHSWVSQYGANPAGLAGDTWGTVLAGLTGEQIAQGMRETLALGSDWPPSAPRFRAMCIGIPSLAATQHAMRTGATDPFTRQAWTYIDSFQFRSADADQAARMMRDAHELTVRFVMDGGELPAEPVAAIAVDPAPEHVPASPDFARQRIEEIQRQLGAGEVA
ncbi:hypothetical protein Fraau_1469 [Frateuria aurantia DSM 6220]|uniref:Uncharacterized protein n=2 Tax=Frateuria aurantia TaxID=81475 RepID=H8L648_FRAAD|nr:hypothetical protein Fraau_1469 [Frateuria aurantia DSM 6220]